jgi:hypothetical protein
LQARVATVAREDQAEPEDLVARVDLVDGERHSAELAQPDQMAYLGRVVKLALLVNRGEPARSAQS